MPDEGGKIEAFGIKLANVPGWVMTAVVGVLVAVVVSLVWWTQVHNPQAVLAAKMQQASVIEYGQHIAETPETTATLFNDARGTLTTSLFGDGCTLLARKHAGKVRTRLVVDLDKQEAMHQSVTTWSVMPTLLAAGPQRRCLNPHAGRFDTWYGERNGCWVEVWRRWPDACEHVQYHNACDGSWDSNPDGSPKVKWTVCVH